MFNFFSSLLIAYFLVAGSHFSAPALAQGACQGLFQDEARVMGRDGQRIVQQAIGDGYEPRYVPTGQAALLRNSRTFDQCGSAECYLFASLATIEIDNLNRRGNHDVPRFSGPYLFARKLLQWIREEIRLGPDIPYYSLKGGTAGDALTLVHQYGLVPESSWSPKVPFEKWDFDGLYHSLESRARAWREQIGDLYVKHGLEDARLLKAHQDAVAELSSYVLELTGPLPDAVHFRNQTLSAKDLARRYGYDHRTVILMQFPSGRISKEEGEYIKGRLSGIVSRFGGAFQFGPAAHAEIEANMVRWIDGGAPVMVSVDWGSPQGPGHMMVVTGYEKKHGTIKRWRVKNSWGEEFGDKGDAWYTAEDLRKNLYQAWRFAKRQ